MILQRPGHDLRGRGGAAIDEDDQRHIGETSIELVGPGIVARAFGVDAAAGEHHCALLEERIRDQHGLIDEPAGVVAQVKDNAARRDALALLVDVFDGLLDAGIGLLGEADQAENCNVAFHLPAHCTRRDDVASEIEIERLAGAFADDRQPDLGAERSAHQAHGFIERHALHRFAVELDDIIVGQDTGARGRRVVDRAHHLDDALFHRDLDAEAAELA